MSIVLSKSRELDTGGGETGISIWRFKVGIALRESRARYGRGEAGIFIQRYEVSIALTKSRELDMGEVKQEYSFGDSK